MNEITFPAYFQVWLIKNKLTPLKLALKTGISGAYFNDVLNGYQSINTVYYSVFCSVMDEDLSRFLDKPTN